MSYFDDALQAFNDKEYYKAIGLYTKHFEEIDTDFNKCNNLYNIGVCYIKLYSKDKDEKYIYKAIESFKLASKYDNKVSNKKMNEVYYNLAVCYEEIKMTNEAYLCMKMALCKNPTDENTIKEMKICENMKFKNILKI